MRARTAALLAAAVTAVAALPVAGCGGGSDAPKGGKIRVAAAFYPLQEVAERIGGDRVQVTGMTPIGGEPHGLVPGPEALAALRASKVALDLGQGFQPGLEKAIAALPASTAKVDVLEGQSLRPAAKEIPGVQSDGASGAASGDDPHVWVDPARYITIAQRTEQALIKADPDGRAGYEQRAAAYIAQLRALDQQFQQALTGCESTVIVTSHAAFGYLAEHYGLTQVAIAGISPDDRPDPASLAATAAYAKRHDVRTVFFETLVPRRLAQTVATKIGAQTDSLNPVEGLTADQLAAGASYLTIQRDNAQRLARGLHCAGAAATTPGGATTPPGGDSTTPATAATTPAPTTAPD